MPLEEDALMMLHAKDSRIRCQSVALRIFDRVTERMGNMSGAGRRAEGRGGLH